MLIICLYVWLSVSFMCILFVCKKGQPIYVSMYLLIFLSIHRNINLSIYLSTCLPVSLFIYLSICLSMHLFVYIHAYDAV